MTQAVSRSLLPGASTRALRPRGVAGHRRGTADVQDGIAADLGDAHGEGPQAGTGGASTRSKALWTLADQAISSATNAAISFLIAHQVSNVEYGAFGVAYTLFALVIGLSRGATCMPLSMFYSGASPSQLRAAASATTGSSLVFGIAVGAVFAAVGLAVGGPVGSSLSAMGLVLPGLLLQDAWRYVFFAMGRPFGAFLNDVGWAVVQVLGIWLLIHRGVTQASPLVLAWGASALVAALLGVVQAGFWPSPGATGRWLAENRTDAAYLAAEFLTVQGALQASILAVGAFGSLATISALQGARTLLGPTTVVGVGMVSFALPEFSRRTSMNVHARNRAAYALSALVVGIGAAWSLVFYLLPERYGQALLGDSWAGVKAILGLSILHYLAAAAPVGPACMVYALGKTKITFRLNAAFAPMLFAFPVIGAVLGEARGAVIGFNIVFWALAPVWFVLLRRLGRQHDAEQAALRAAGGAPGGAADSDRTAAGEPGAAGGPGSRRERAAAGRGGRRGTPDRRSGAAEPARPGWDDDPFHADDTRARAPARRPPRQAGAPREAGAPRDRDGWIMDDRAEAARRGGARATPPGPPGAEGTGGWAMSPDSAGRGDRSITKRWDGNSSTKVRQTDAPEESRREASRTRRSRMERDVSSPPGRSGHSERGIGGMDDVYGTGPAWPGRRDGHDGQGRTTGPRRGRHGA
jgi:hypothetical protein